MVPRNTSYEVISTADQ